MNAATSSRAGGESRQVVVVGARCAGSATAMLLARQGVDVLMLDRATFPSDTLSTHAIARGGMVQLSRWGLLDAVVESGAPPIRTVTFHLADGTVLEKKVKDRAGVDFLLAPRRHVLDSVLASAAVEAGARLETAATVTGVLTDSTGRVTGVSVRDDHGNGRRVPASIVVGADGVRSRIARAVGARVLDDRPSEGATHYAYVAGLDGEGFEFHVGERAIAGVFRTHGGEANVWVCSHAAEAAVGAGDRGAAFMRLLERTAPELAARVVDATVTSVVRGAVRFPNHVREAAGSGWALVGDAAYHRDPITGHGITDAFRDAELLAFHLGQALRGEVGESEALAAYAEERHQVLAPHLRDHVPAGLLPASGRVRGAAAAAQRSARSRGRLARESTSGSYRRLGGGGLIEERRRDASALCRSGRRRSSPRPGPAGQPASCRGDRPPARAPHAPHPVTTGTNHLPANQHPQQTTRSIR